VPKAELHVHIEGTIEPEQLFRIAARNSIELPYSLEDCKNRRKDYSDLQDFLNLYYDACRALKTTEDFYDVAKAYLQRAVQEGITHAEIFFDPQTHLAQGTTFETFFTGLLRASDEMKDEISSQWIMCFLRDLSEESALQVISMALPFKDRILGVGLDSAEVGNPPKKFKKAFEIAAAKGLCGNDCTLKVAHAGEEEDASSVIAALFHLQIKRIDHGVRAVDSNSLCKFLKDSQVGVTCCPVSNKMLKVQERFFHERSAIKMLFQQGVIVTVNSDDPAFFGAYICGNFEEVLKEFDEDQRIEVLRKLCKNSFFISFIPESLKEENYKKIDSVIDGYSS
jgi:adenosine deaminase